MEWCNHCSSAALFLKYIAQLFDTQFGIRGQTTKLKLDMNRDFARTLKKQMVRREEGRRDNGEFCGAVLTVCMYVCWLVFFFVLLYCMVQETFSSTEGVEKLQVLKNDMDKVASNVHENISTVVCLVEGRDEMSRADAGGCCWCCMLMLNSQSAGSRG